ncbi:hypothetical protein RCL1_001713 [Eukaryota sp. TZLM3-RCL]
MCNPPLSPITNLSTENVDFTPEELFNFMELAIQEAESNETLKEGGPFGAIVVDKITKEVVSAAHNEVLLNCDPSCHAEVMAIRKACKKRGTISLDNCVLITSAYCCPLCYSCAAWARISTVYFGANLSSADGFGFADLKMYEDLKRDVPENIKFLQVKHPRAVSVFERSTSQLY